MLSCLISTIVIFILLLFSNTSSKIIKFNIIPVNSNIYSKNTISQNFVIENNNNTKESELKKDEWKIEIPRIDLNAQISEGTSQNVLNQYVGHFSETSIWNGNIGLAAHNRGYNVNYFEKIKELEVGDEIFYTYNENTRKFIVKTRDIIKETDWSYLEETEDNILTLITCVENLSEYRRCIQAIEYKEEID